MEIAVKTDAIARGSDAPDGDLIAEWIKHLYGECSRGYVNVSLQRRHFVAHSFSVLDCEEAAAFCEREALEGNEYLAVSTSEEAFTTGRGDAKSAFEFPGLWLDIDFAGTGHGAPKLPRWRDEANVILEAIGLAPTAILSTGRGWHVWWCFDQPRDASKIGDLVKMWGEYVTKCAHGTGFHVDNVFDHARVMRAPGTMNHNLKDDDGNVMPAVISIVDEDWTVRYAPDTIANHIALASTETSRATVAPFDDDLVPDCETDGERPGDVFNSQHGCAEVLEAYGFTFVRTDANGNSHFVRPYSTTGEPHLTVYADTGKCTVFTPNIPGLEQNRTYDAFGLHVCLTYGDDSSESFTRAARTLVGPIPLVSKVVGASSSEPWPELQLIGDPEPEEFPIASLPGSFGEYARAMTASLETPLDLAAIMIMAAVSVAVCGRLSVLARGDWSEPVQIWVLVVLPPGERKSEVVKRVAAPIRRVEKELIALAVPTVAQRVKRDVAKAKAKRLRKGAEGETDAVEAERMMVEAIEAEMDFEKLDVGTFPQLLADDITPEKFASVLAAQGGRIGVIAAEGGLFATIGGRYSRSIPNLDPFLKAHSGESIRVDRQNRPPDVVERANATLGLAVQPDVWSDVASKREFRGVGFLARILVCVPMPSVGGRNYEGPDIPSAVTDGYDSSLHKLALSAHEWGDLTALILQRDALKAHRVWHDEIESELKPGSALAATDGWGAKLSGATLRIAGLLHAMKHLDRVRDFAIDGATMDDAILIARYFRAHALRAYAIAGLDPALVAARKLLDWITAKGHTTFRKTDARRHLNITAKEVESALEVLIEHGWIAKRHHLVGVRGAPAKVFDVNPLASRCGARS